MAIFIHLLDIQIYQFYLMKFLHFFVSTDIFPASLLILYCTFSSLIISSITIISFYILSKRCFLKREKLSDTRVVSITKNEYGFTVNFLYRFKKSSKLNI